MNEYECPFCGQIGGFIDDVTFSEISDRSDLPNKYGPIVCSLQLFSCPNPRCGELSIHFATWKAKFPENTSQYMNYREPDQSAPLVSGLRIRPTSRAKTFPAVVPKPLLRDYAESCSIEGLSPKASATLSRRVLQGIIRDFFHITGKRTLRDEIQAIQGLVEPEVWSAIDALRKVGNIGAHFEADINTIVDVDPGEAAALIGLVEMLFRETYIARERRQRSLDEIVDMAVMKHRSKTPKEGTA